MMATLDEVGQALQKAHEAGDTQGATILAREYKRQQEAVAIRDVAPSMSGTETFLAGMGKAFHDVGTGAGQLLREGIETVSPQKESISGLITGKKDLSFADRLGLPTRADVDENKRLEQSLMNTTSGKVGNVAGSVAAAAPAMLIPGGQTVAGGAITGAALAALQPVGMNDSRTQNMAVGGTVGAAVPALINGAKAAKAAVVDPFTEKGRQMIAARLLRRQTTNPDAVIESLSNAAGATPGFNPTVGQAAGDDGIAALERTIRQTYPQGFNDVEKSQRGALVDALRSIAKTPEDRAAAVEAVDKQAKQLYGDAFKESVEVTPALSRLSGKPSMKAAEKRALSLADELGINFDARLKDMRPQYEPYKPVISPSSVETVEDVPAKMIPLGRRSLPDARVLEKAKPMDYTDQIDKVIPQGKGPQEYFELPGYQKPKTLSIPAEPRPSAYMEIPPVETVPVRDMHTLKMGMDALLQDPTLGIAGREAAAVKATRSKLLDLLPESYQKARLGHIEMNRPVNQMDIGQELYNRFLPALSDQGGEPFRSTAQAYANALRNGDKLAKNVTGLKNAKLAEIMTPEQMNLLQGVAKDSATRAAAETAGRGVGSDTVQKLAMSNIAAQAGIPNWMADVAKVPGGWAKRVGDLAYGDADEQVRLQLARLLQNPQEAAAAMSKAGVPPNSYAKYLKAMAQAAAVGSTNSAINQGE